ncbi:unnamed protein product [Alternaria alternata]
MSVRRSRPSLVSLVRSEHRLAEFRQLASKDAPAEDPYYGPEPECSRGNAVTTKTREAVLLLSIAEVITMAVEELITIATEMTKPFIHDTRYSNPRGCMPEVQSLVDEFHSFADRLVSSALDLEAGPSLSNAQAALGSKHVAKSANWTDDHAALTAAIRKTTSWSTCDYPGLSYVLQIKLFRDQPDLLTDNAEPFLLYRDGFLLAARQLLDRLQFQVPSYLKSSQFFIPLMTQIALEDPYPTSYMTRRS